MAERTLEDLRDLAEVWANPRGGVEFGPDQPRENAVPTPWVCQMLVQLADLAMEQQAQLNELREELRRTFPLVDAEGVQT